MKWTRKIFTLIFLLASLGVFAQQEAMFTHYMYNTLSINPGYAGSRDALTITGLHRSQWVGFNGAPTSQTLTLHTPLFRDDLGFGLSVINDQIGPVNLTSVFIDFSYRLDFKEGKSLSFGLKSGFNMMQVGLQDLVINDVADNAFLTDVESKMLPNFGFGLYYRADRSYIGISSPRLLENDYLDNTSSGGLNLASESKHYFFIAGTMIDIGSNMQLRPTTFVKATSGAPIEADFTGVLVYDDKLWGGLMIRTGDAGGILIGMKAMQNLDIGYSYDWSFGLKSGKYNGGSHEIMLRYDFIFKDKEKIRSPRYF